MFAWCLISSGLFFGCLFVLRALVSFREVSVGVISSVG